MKRYFHQFQPFIYLFLCLFFYINPCVAEKTVLKIAGWDVYADPVNKNKTIGYESFEQQYNTLIEFTPLQNLDAIIDVAESKADFDIFLISNEGIKLLHDMELVKPLELSRIPNYKSLHHNLQYSNWGLFDGNVYAVPWAWGPTGLLYNQDVIPQPDSWGILWDPRYKGQVALWDDVSMIWVTALYLGYKNVYSLTREQLNHVKTSLLELNKNTHGYYKGENEALIFATQNNVIAMNSWFDPSERLKAKKLNFKMLIPKEGAVGMFDSYLINKNGKNINESYNYINHQISPLIQKQMVETTGLSPSNIETLGLLTKDEIKALHLDEQDYFNKMILWDHMPRKHLYEELLSEIRNDFKKRRQK
ncbi:MAG: extracellular solute-binding protein [Gammaproteobacteria bacterium]|nr:extracellular solute-binding protein [Gammaproteobacteria bacterium]